MHSHVSKSKFIDPFWEPWYIHRYNSTIHLQKTYEQIQECEKSIRQDPALKCIVIFRFIFDVMVTESLYVCDANDISFAEDIIEQICEDPPCFTQPHNELEKPHLHLKLENLYMGFQFIENLSLQTSISEELICDLHKIILQGDAFAHHTPGVYRESQVKPVTSENDLLYAHPCTISILLKNLCQVLNDEAKTHILFQDRLRLACWFLVEFLRIHPFHHGNGRTARLLMHFILRPVTTIPCGLCIGTNMQRNRERYVQALHRFDRSFAKKGTSDMCTLALHSLLWSTITLNECFTDFK